MTNDELNALAERRILGLKKSLGETINEVFAKNEDFQREEPVVQEIIRAIVLHNMARRYGGFKHD